MLERASKSQLRRLALTFPPFRIIVTGSRTWTDEQIISDALDEEIAEAPRRGYDGEIVVVHGDCREGADRIADYLVTLYDDSVRAERHPADWDQYGKSAGFQRNGEMVAAGADVCLAFLMPCMKENCREREPHPSHGARHCANLAGLHGILVRRFVK